MAAGGGGGGAVHLTGKMRSCENGRPLDSVFASAPSNSFLGALTFDLISTVFDFLQFVIKPPLL